MKSPLKMMATCGWRWTSLPSGTSLAPMKTAATGSAEHPSPLGLFYLAILHATGLYLLSLLFLMSMRTPWSLHTISLLRFNQLHANSHQRILSLLYWLAMERITVVTFVYLVTK